MTIAYYIFVVLHVIACLFLIGIVLLQQGKSQDLASAFGGGGTQTAFGPRGSANVLSRGTTILAALFMVTSLALSLLRPHESSFLDQVATPSPAPSAAATPIAPPVTFAPQAPANVPAAAPTTVPAAPAASPRP